MFEEGDRSRTSGTTPGMRLVRQWGAEDMKFGGAKVRACAYMCVYACVRARMATRVRAQ